MAPLPKDIIIIGGSLTALFHGIMLLEYGHNVHIIERDSGNPESHMAGICAAEHVLTFIRKFDRMKEPLGIPSEFFQSLDPLGNVRPFLKAHRVITSWDALYWRLRVGFDGAGGDFYDVACEESLEQKYEMKKRGKGFYDTGKRVVRISTKETGVTVSVVDAVTKEEQILTAGLVIGADGPNSLVRETLLPNVSIQRTYAGYVAWRGVVPENNVSLETRKIFQKNISYVLLPGEHMIIYHIPGLKGSVEDGHRLLNFCWYSNHPPSSLPDLLTDINGHKHHSTVPGGKVRPSLWAKRLEHARTVDLPKPFMEVLERIPSPFLQVISDHHSRRAASEDGKILLVGDAMTTYRPHTAFSTNQGAYDALMLEKVVRGDIGIEQWEQKVLQFGYLQWCRSLWFGAWFQKPWWSRLAAGFWYWKAAAAEMLRRMVSDGDWRGVLRQ